MMLTISAIILYLVTLGVTLFGVMYTFSPKIMPYHETFLGRKYEALDPKVAQLFMALLRTGGVAFFSAAIAAFALITWPFRAGELWAKITVIVMLLLPLLAILRLSLSLGRFTPWRLILIMIVLVVVAAVLAFIG